MKVERKCKIVSKEQMGDAVYMVLEAGDMVRTSFRAPGQFVHVKCGEGLLLRRPISICNWSAQRDLVRLVFEVRGEGTEWLARRQVGDSLDVLGPLGHGFQMEQGGRYLLVGGGIGVPPMLGCAKWTAGQSTAVLGFRSADRAMLTEEFQKCCKDVLLCSDDGSLGQKGFVDAQVRAVLEKDKNFTAVLACGPKPMLKNVAAVAAEYGVPCQVSMEERMACGVGACLGCAIQMADGTMKHVCKDGPVFDAEEVEWNV